MDVIPLSSGGGIANVDIQTSAINRVRYCVAYRWDCSGRNQCERPVNRVRYCIAYRRDCSGRNQRERPAARASHTTAGRAGIDVE